MYNIHKLVVVLCMLAKVPSSLKIKWDIKDTLHEIKLEWNAFIFWIPPQICAFLEAISS